MKRIWRLLILAVAVAAMLTPSWRSAPTAHADYGKAIYQITMSENCNNPAVCGPNLGGFWGWAALFGTADSGTGDGEFTFCGHTIAAGGPGLAGAGHQSVDFTWTVALGSAGPRTVFVTSETDVFRGHGDGTQTIPSENMDVGVPLPDTAGTTIHLSTADVFGSKAPGVSFMINVVRLPNT